MFQDQKLNVTTPLEGGRCLCSLDTSRKILLFSRCKQKIVSIFELE
jgi:hypothetical protein